MTPYLSYYSILIPPIPSICTLLFTSPPLLFKPLPSALPIGLNIAYFRAFPDIILAYAIFGLTLVTSISPTFVSVLPSDSSVYLSFTLLPSTILQIYFHLLQQYHKDLLLLRSHLFEALLEDRCYLLCQKRVFAILSNIFVKTILAFSCFGFILKANLDAEPSSA